MKTMNKYTRLKKQDCINLKQEINELFDIDLGARSRKYDVLIPRAAFIASVMNEFILDKRPIWDDLATAINYDRCTAMYHYKSHKANYADVNIPFNQSYRSWYRRFTSHIWENYTIKNT